MTKSKKLLIISILALLWAATLALFACDGHVEEATGLEYVLSYDGTYYIVSGIGSETRTAFAIPSEHNGKPVKEICTNAFYMCESLTSIKIPDSVTSIGFGVFSGCSRLKSIVVSDGNTVYHSKDNCLIETATNTLRSGCKSSVIPDYVTSIGVGAFTACEHLTSIKISDSVTSIGRCAFCYCTSLARVTIGNGVTSIGESAFSNCSALTSIKIPDSVTSIDRFAFSGCSNLTSIKISDSVTSIGEGAFAHCTNLASVIIGNNVTSIGFFAFECCSNLATINYAGTQEEWEAMTKVKGWDYNTGSYIINYNYVEE